VVSQLEEPQQACVQQACLPVRVAGNVQVGSTDVADQERVAAEHEPGLLGAAASVGYGVGVVGRRVSRRCDRGHERVAELDRFTVDECDVLERNSRIGRQVGGRTGALDQSGQPRDVVRLYVRLEDGNDRRPQFGRRGQIVVDQIRVRIDHRQLAVRAAAEQVAGTRACVVQERT